MKKSPIDHIRLLDQYGSGGPPVLFSNMQIRLMLNLAGASEKDVFYDLGCGFGQNLILAVTEFRVKRAVGVEGDKRRYAFAKRYAKMWPQSDRIDLVKGNFMDLLESDDDFLDDASIIFYGLETDAEIFRLISKKLSRRTDWKLVYYFNCLFPEVKPDKIRFPFYLSIPPLAENEPHSSVEWLNSVVRKGSVYDNEKLKEEELWKELSHDYHVTGLSRTVVRETINDYKRRLSVIDAKRSRSE